MAWSTVKNPLVAGGYASFASHKQQRNSVRWLSTHEGVGSPLGCVTSMPLKPPRGIRWVKDSSSRGTPIQRLAEKSAEHSLMEVTMARNRGTGLAFHAHISLAYLPETSPWHAQEPKPPQVIPDYGGIV